jgi:hypothetical protein
MKRELREGEITRLGRLRNEQGLMHECAILDSDHCARDHILDLVLKTQRTSLNERRCANLMLWTPRKSVWIIGSCNGPILDV